MLHRDTHYFVVCPHLYHLCFKRGKFLFLERIGEVSCCCLVLKLSRTSSGWVILAAFNERFSRIELRLWLLRVRKLESQCLLRRCVALSVLHWFIVRYVIRSMAICSNYWLWGICMASPSLERIRFIIPTGLIIAMRRIFNRLEVLSHSRLQNWLQWFALLFT